MNDVLCPRCGAPLRNGALVGQCPRCLGALAFGFGETVGARPEIEQARDLRPKFAGDYELVRELGRGGMGVVYEARQPGLQRRVAVKMILAGGWAEPSAKARFLTEASAAARLRHPGIVAVYEVGELSGQPFFAMELINGPSLADVARTLSVPPRTSARYLRLVAEAIAHAHASGILHRDLKPANVLIDEHDQPRVTDFGLAKELDSTSQLTRSGELMGSPNYLAPEQLAGAPAAAAGDIYALGALLYQLLTTKPPFVAATVAATLELVRTAEPIAPHLLNPSIPRDLETICLKCLRKEPTQRYLSAQDLAADLTRFEAAEPIGARPVPLPERFLLWCRRKPTLAAVSLALAVALTMGISGIVWQWRRAETSREEMRRNLYAADVAAASAAVREGNLGQARRLLRNYLPAVSAASDLPDLCDFTWRLLWALGDDIAVLGTHPGVVTCVAVSPDGRWAASGSQEPPGERGPCLRLWPLESFSTNLVPSPALTPRKPITLPSQGTVWSVGFTADGLTLISAGTEGVRAWDVHTGRSGLPIANRPGQEVAVAGSRGVASPNPPFFESPTDGPMWWFDLATGEVRELPVRGRHPALSPDGRHLAFLDTDQNIQLAELPSGRILRTVCPNRQVFRLRFSPDGRRLAAAGQMTSARIWNLDDAAAPGLRFEGEHNVWDAAFSPDGRTLYAATSDQQLECWDIESGRRRVSLAGHDDEIWSVAPSSDGRFLVSGGKDRTVRLWSTEPPRPRLSLLHDRLRPASVSADGTRLLTQTRSNGLVIGHVWEFSGVKERGAAACREVGSLARRDLVPLGFAAGEGHEVLALRTDRPVLEWWSMGASEPSRRVELLQAPTSLGAEDAYLAQDGGSLVGRDAQGSLVWWTTDGGRRLGGWQDAGFAVADAGRGGVFRRRLRSFAMSRTGRFVALAPFDAEVPVLVDLQRGEGIKLRGHRDDVAALAFGAGDRELVTGGIDGTMRIWSVPGGEPLGEIHGHMESLEALAFSPDGQTLVSGSVGTEVRFWHRPTRRELARFSHLEAGAHFLFTPDGRRLLLGAGAGRPDEEGDNDRVEIWDAPPVP